MVKRKGSEIGPSKKASKNNIYIESSGVCFTFEQILRPSMDALCDVDLVIDGEVFKCHRIFLVAHSRSFESMFTNGMRESRQRVITKGLNMRYF